MAAPEVRSTLERNECVRRYTASMPNDAFARLVDRVAGNARSGAPWAEELLYHWVDTERSDTKRTVLLQEMVRSSFLGCPFECLTRLAAVPETNVSSLSAELLVMAGPAGEQALIRALPRIRGYQLSLAIGALRDGSVPLDADLLSEYIRHPNRFVRHTTLGLLGRRGDSTCTPHLLEALARPDRSTWESALLALGVVGDARAVDAILNRLRTHAARKSGLETPFVELELNFLGQHAHERPDAFATAREIVVSTWAKRNEEETYWITRFLPQVAPHAREPLQPPTTEAVATLKAQMIEHQRRGARIVA
ncbi:hypothetical protein ACG83_15415 [Frankia sp. R43]|uniref:HEAT repeat domain-containing protein n=1 Tax=Frankia sp. R43 TaxID=269536 RepID=UPI0006CA550F|nr:HEAT repeat domain-containing protein [Frankia sp. R43]KPM54813.1 hypothetical protein ACG83_15415 [Frankia sp. R43]